MSETDEGSCDLPTPPSRREEDWPSVLAGLALKILCTASRLTQRQKLHTLFPSKGPSQAALTSDVGFKHGGIHVDIKVHIVLEHFNHSLEFRDIPQNLGGKRHDSEALSGLKALKMLD